MSKHLSPDRDASQRTLAVAAGVFYLITHVTSVGAAALYGPVLMNSDFIAGNGPVAPELAGILFEVILAMAIVGTAVALYPVMKRRGEGLALGYVGLRTLEAGVITVGVIPLMAIVALRHAALAGATDADTLVTIASALVPVYKATLLVGPGFICSVNTVVMATLMFRSRLVPRYIPLLGLVGGPLIFVFSTVRSFSVVDQLPDWAGIAVIPIFAWEVTLAVTLITRGFRSVPGKTLPEAAAHEAPAAVSQRAGL